MKQLLLLLLIISAIGCKEQKKDNVVVGVDTALASMSSINTEPPFDTVVKQDVRMEGDNYALQTYVLTLKGQFAPYIDCNGVMADHINTGYENRFPQFNKTICGSFDYIVKNKKRMYQEAWTFIRTKAAREKAIADSIKMIQDLSITEDKETVKHNVAIGEQSLKELTLYVVSYTSMLPEGVVMINSRFNTLDSAFNHAKVIFPTAISGVAITKEL